MELMKSSAQQEEEEEEEGVYRVWRAAGQLGAAGLSSHQGRSPQTGSGPRRSLTGRRCCGISLCGGTEELSSGWDQTG